MNNKKYPLHKSEAEWREELGDEQYRVLREKGTERPFTGEYNLHSENGAYQCGACNAPLFVSKSKFDSGCGWPSFDESIKDSIEYVKDTSLGMHRMEILCSNCGSHIGHVFPDGPTETGQRYCVNSVSIDFKKKE